MPLIFSPRSLHEALSWRSESYRVRFSATTSTIDHRRVGNAEAAPSSLPSISDNTSFRSAAAPVDIGTMLRAPRAHLPQVAGRRLIEDSSAS